MEWPGPGRTDSHWTGDDCSPRNQSPRVRGLARSPGTRGKIPFLKILPISLVPEVFDQPFQLVELAAPGDQGRLAGLDHDDVVEAERGNQAAVVVGDDDRVCGLVGEHVALDGV